MSVRSQASAPRQAYARRQGRAGNGLALAALAALLSWQTAQAEDVAKISQRIAAVFNLVLDQPAEAAEPFAMHALLRRAEAEGHSVDNPAGDPVAALAYSAAGPAPSAFGDGGPASLAAGMFGQTAAAESAIVLARLPRARPEPPLITGSIAPSGVSEAAFFTRFAGSFTGSGDVRRNARAGAHQVDCTLTGAPTASGITIAGECGASIFSRKVSAEIVFDPATGTYSGTYVGSSAGPARLWGKRRGDEVVLVITWPKLVNGDTKATMIIRNSGNGRLAISVIDAVHPGGPQAEVTNLALSRS